jgi:hypothetical protein
MTAKLITTAAAPKPLAVYLAGKIEEEKEYISSASDYVGSVAWWRLRLLPNTDKFTDTDTWGLVYDSVGDCPCPPWICTGPKYKSCHCSLESEDRDLIFLATPWPSRNATCCLPTSAPRTATGPWWR